VDEAALDEMLRKAGEIVDPVEAALFTFAHLAALAPFNAENEALARLAASIPLVRARLRPLTFRDTQLSLIGKAFEGVRRLGRVEVLRDLFKEAYLHAAMHPFTRADYALPDLTADPFRLRYESTLAEVMRGVMQGSHTPERQRIAKLAGAQVPHEDLEPFVQTALTLLFKLGEKDNAHDGFARYGFAPGDVQQWRARLQGHAAIVP